MKLGEISPMSLKCKGRNLEVFENKKDQKENERIFNIQIKEKHNMSTSTLSEINNTCNNGVFSTMQLEKV